MLIVSFTTIPDRLEKGLPERCIQTLLRQETKVDLILVNIPRVSRKGVTYNAEKANALEETGVIVNWVETDAGPITKLFGTLDYIEKHNIHDARIVLVDDDVEYEPWMIQHLLAANQAAAGFVSRDPILSWGRISGTTWLNKEQAPTAFLETYAGVMYDASLFLPYANIRDWVASLPSNCHNADDILIGAWVQRKGVISMRLASEKDPYKHDAAGTTELRSINLGDNNDIVVQYLFDNFEFPHWQTPLSYAFALFFHFWWILLLFAIALCVYGMYGISAQMPLLTRKVTSYSYRA
jgi:hypothetical protein